MTAAPKKVIPSVDYTSRDYAALRAELILRLKDRVPNWTGEDPSDFGVALVESFAYMGDLVNYYIDRIANESYILTATQRQSLLNLASMYGYYPKGYVGASCTATFTNSYGYRGAIGGTILDNKKAYVIVPNDAYESLDIGDTVTITGRTQDAYNGTFTLLDNSSLPGGITAAGGTSANVLVYQPSASITNYTVNTVSSGVYNVTFTYNFGYPKLFVATQSVSVSGVGMSSSGTGTVNATFTVASATATTFTTTNITATVPTKTFATPGVAEFENISISSTAEGFVYETGYTVIPAGTQFNTDVVYNDTVEQVIFSSVGDVSIPYQGTQSIELTQGENITVRPENAYDPLVVGDISGEYVGSTDGAISQYYPLAESKVDANTLKVYVQSGNRYALWKQVDNLNDWSGTATVYSVTFDEDGISYLVFGDNVSGAIPPQDAKIKAQYFAGVGNFGNIQSNVLDYYFFPAISSIDQSTIRTHVTVTHTAATGGSDPESDESIRVNAPRTLRALNRAVTLQDYADVALGVSRVGKAKAEASTWTSVNVYVASTTETDTLEVNQVTLDTVTEALSSRSQIGTTVSVFGPQKVDAILRLKISVTANYTETQVRSFLKTILLETLSFQNAFFGQTITPSDIEFICRSVPGVDTVKVTHLHRDGGSGLNTLVGVTNELFSFSEDNIEFDTINTGATLTSVTTSEGSVTAVANTLGYTKTVGSGVTSITVTPSVSTGATVSVANQQVLSGTTSSAIPLSSGTKRIWIVVTAENAQITNQYYIDVTKP
jgi:hypothetical protein